MQILDSRYELTKKLSCFSFTESSQIWSTMTTAVAIGLGINVVKQFTATGILHYQGHSRFAFIYCNTSNSNQLLVMSEFLFLS